MLRDAPYRALLSMRVMILTSPPASRGSACTGQSSISTLSVRLSRIMYADEQLERDGDGDGEPDRPPAREEEADHHEQRVGHRVDDAVAVIVERDGRAAIALDQAVVFSITSQDASMAIARISRTPKDIGIQRERSQSSQ